MEPDDALDPTTAAAAPPLETTAAEPQEPAAPPPAAPPAEDYRTKYEQLQNHYQAQMRNIGGNLQRVAEADERLKFLVEQDPSSWGDYLSKLTPPTAPPPTPPAGMTPELQKWLEQRDNQIVSRYDAKIAEFDAFRQNQQFERITEERAGVAVREMAKHDAFRSDEAFEMARPIIAQQMLLRQPQNPEEISGIIKDVAGAFDKLRESTLQAHASLKGKQRATTPPAVTGSGGSPSAGQPKKEKLSAEDGSAVRALQGFIDSKFAE